MKPQVRPIIHQLLKKEIPTKQIETARKRTKRGLWGVPIKKLLLAMKGAIPIISLHSFVIGPSCNTYWDCIAQRFVLSKALVHIPNKSRQQNPVSKLSTVLFYITSILKLHSDKQHLIRASFIPNKNPSSTLAMAKTNSYHCPKPY